MSDSYDVVVLGTGAAGLSAALTAATLGASVGLFEKAATVGGTTATSGGVAWVPAHDRPGTSTPATLDEAFLYLRSLSHGTMDEELVDIFVRSAASVLDFLESNSSVRFTVADGFPDYKPELPGGRPQGGRSFNPSPFDYGQLGDWADRVTAFPLDWSNVGFDAETRARFWGDAEFGDDMRVTGAALVGGLLRALLDRDVVPRTEHRAVELVRDGATVTGVVFETPDGRTEVRAQRGVVLATGGFEWNADLVKAFLRGPMNGAVSPPGNTGDGLQMAMKAGAALGNMKEAWWVPVVKLPGDEFRGEPRSRSVRLERTRPRSIIVNKYGRRFANEAADYNSLGGPFHHFDATAFEYANTPAWIVFDRVHLETYGFLGVEAGADAVHQLPEWVHRGDDLSALARVVGIDPDGLSATVAAWNESVAVGHDPDFGRGASAYDSYWGDPSQPTPAARTLGPIDSGPYYAMQVDIGCMGTKGGPRTDVDARVLGHDGEPIPGLYAAGNAMAGPTGIAYGGAGGTIGPALVFGHRAAKHAVTAPLA